MVGDGESDSFVSVFSPWTGFDAEFPSTLPPTAEPFVLNRTSGELSIAEGLRPIPFSPLDFENGPTRYELVVKVLVWLARGFSFLEFVSLCFFFSLPPPPHVHPNHTRPLDEHSFPLSLLCWIHRFVLPFLAGVVCLLPFDTGDFRADIIPVCYCRMMVKTSHRFGTTGCSP